MTPPGPRNLPRNDQQKQTAHTAETAYIDHTIPTMPVAVHAMVEPAAV